MYCKRVRARETYIQAKRRAKREREIGRVSGLVKRWAKREREALTEIKRVRVIDRDLRERHRCKEMGDEKEREALTGPKIQAKRERGIDKGKDIGIDKRYRQRLRETERGIDRGIDRGIERVIDRGIDRGID